MRLLKLLFAIAIFLALAIVAHAHPGRTDSAGGHSNHSTGEYHYHHGYSAHQHYDKDGDGTLDCPYSFNDKTGSSSGGKSSPKPSTQPSVKAESQNWKGASTEKYKTILDHIGIALSRLWDILFFCFELFMAWLCFLVVCEIIRKIFKR